MIVAGGERITVYNHYYNLSILRTEKACSISTVRTYDLQKRNSYSPSILPMNSPDYT